MPDAKPKRGRGRPPGRNTKARNLSVTDADWAYLLSRNLNPSKALRELIAEARQREAAQLDLMERLIDARQPGA